MDTETIQQLIETFQAMGGDAKTAFVWWLVLTKGVTLVLSLAGIGATAWAVKTIVRATLLSPLTEIRAAANVVGGSCSSREWGAVLKCLREHYRDTFDNMS